MCFMADELWQSHTPGGLQRVLGASGSRTPFLLGLAGIAAFGASLVLDWVRISIARQGGLDPGFSLGGSVVSAGFGLPGDSVGLAYLLSVLGLIATLGAVLGRPDTALRLRMAVSGLGVGVLAVLAAVALGGTDRFLGQEAGLQTLLGSTAIGSTFDNAKVGYEPGIFCAAGAVVLLVVGIWRAGAPAERVSMALVAHAAAQTPRPEPLSAVSAVPAPAAPPSSRIRPTGRAGFADGLTVTSAGSIDPGTNPDILPG
jgi:hypothetical protein